MKEACLGVLASMLLSVGVEAAVITRIEPFEGQFSEGFEEIEPLVYFETMEVFEGHAVVESTIDCQCLLTAMGWTTPYDNMRRHGGSWMMGSRQGSVRWVFDTPAVLFGGYFAGVDLLENEPRGVAEFFDENGLLLGSDDVTAPFHSQWAWNGWAFDVPVKSITISGLGPEGWNWLGGLIMHDDMEFTAVPEPATISLLGLAGLAFLRKRRV